MAKVRSWCVVAWVACASDLHRLGIDGIFKHKPHSWLP